VFSENLLGGQLVLLLVFLRSCCVALAIAAVQRLCRAPAGGFDRIHHVHLRVVNMGMVSGILPWSVLPLPSSATAVRRS